ncbi:TetR/AcrR family transcriptional regulator, partial [Paenibacillus sp. TAF43_2]
INTANSSAAARDLEFIEEAHMTLKIQLSRLFERAQKGKSLRQDIPLPVLIGVFFNLINTPNMLNIPIPDWGKLLFQMWIGGAKS